MRKFIILLMMLPLAAFAAPNAVVYNITNQQVISGSLYSEEVSIASISKLITVYTVLPEHQDLEETTTVTGNTMPNTFISKGMTLTRLELINLALVSSDNLAAQTLAENFPGGYSWFIHKMNENAKELGMHNTGFVEPTGLSPMNHSTLNDIILLTREVSKLDIVKTAAQSSQVTFTQPVTQKKKTITKKIVKNSTIKYFGREGVVTIKTGFTRAAGFCVTMLVQANNGLYNITVLGAKTKQERQKIIEEALRIIYTA